MHLVVAAIGSGIVTAAVIALGAVGFTMQYGISRIFNISFGAMMTVSAFLAYYVDIDFHTNLWVGVVVGAAVGCLLAIASERFVFAPFRGRRAGLFTLVMVSLAVAVFTQNLILAVAGPHYYSFSVPPERVYHVLGTNWTSLQITIVIIAAVGMVVVHLLLSRTRLGKAMRAAAADPELAGSTGINVGRVRMIAWAISGTLAGVAGVFLAVSTASFSFDVSTSFVFVVFAAAVVGGIGQPYGAMLGALIVGLATSEAAIVIPSTEYVVAFVLLVAVLLVRPSGIIQIGGRARQDILTI